MGAGSFEELEAFFARYAETSMFQRSNLRWGGLEDHGEVYQGTYVGERDGAGALCAVVAHYWNGCVMVQAPGGPTGALVRGLREACGREVDAILGPYEQVVATQVLLGMEEAPCARASKEYLYARGLEGVEAHGLLSEVGVVARRAREEDLDVLAAWRAAYMVEALWMDPSEVDEREAREGMARSVEQRRGWVLERDGVLVAYTGNNAEIEDTHQLGGVWTPPEHRGRGYAKAVITRQLMDMREEGKVRAILFTDEENVSAQRAYEGIGFERIGEYGMFVGFGSGE